MNIFFKVFIFSSISGFAVVLGGYLGTKNIPDKILAFVLAFGSGVLLAVLSYSLMHEAYRQSGPVFTSVAFIIGGAFFYLIERLMTNMLHQDRSNNRYSLDDLPGSPEYGDWPSMIAAVWEW